MRSTTDLIGSLIRFGKAGGALGQQIDAMRYVGLRRSLRFLRDENGLDVATRRSIYLGIWRSAARAIGATPHPWPEGPLEVRKGRRSTLLWLDLVPLDDPVTTRIAANKLLTHRLLTDAGIRTPRHIAVPIADLGTAERFLLTVGTAFVKPPALTGAGSGVTGAVKTHDDLARARLRAARYDAETMLVEEEVTGVEYRVLVLASQPIGIIERSRPILTGNGQSSIRELVEAENLRRQHANGRAGYRRLVQDLDMVLTLRRQGLVLRSTVASGLEFECKSSASQISERDAVVRQLDDPKLAGVLSTAAHAAQAVSAEFVSVELVVQDTESPESRSAPVVLELNGTPGIAHHYIVRNTEDITPVARRVLEHLLS